MHAAVNPERAYTLVEMLACAAVLAVACALIAPAVWKIYESSSLAVSANNIRQLSAGAQAYLAENDHRFWSFCENRATVLDEAGNPVTGARWWFGFESNGSKGSGEGNRQFDPSQGPLAGYVPKGIRPDPSLALRGSALKPKYQSGYIGVGYNVVLANGWTASARKPPLSFWELSNPARVAVFATSAQVNDFQAPASATDPKIEEFYGFDQREKTIHFRHGTLAMVGFADGHSGFLPLDESTRDSRLEGVNIGRFAPVGSFDYLK